MLSDNVDFDGHLGDVMSIISCLLTPPERKRNQLIVASHLFDFIVMRCYRKLYARLESGINLWTRHSLEALRDFYYAETSTVAQESSPAEVGRASSLSDDVNVKMPQAYAYLDLLVQHGIACVRGEGYPVSYQVTFSASTAPAWAKVLHACFLTMFDTLSQDREAEGQGRKARRPISHSERRNLHAALALLDDAIRGRIVERLFPDKLVDKLNDQYVKNMQMHAYPQLASAHRIFITSLTQSYSQRTYRSYQ